MGGIQGSYIPGDWVGIAGDRTWVIVDSESISPIIGDLWDALKVFRDPLDFIDVITVHGIRNIPSFAFASITESGIWIIVRGRASVKTFRGIDSFDLGSSDSKTWQEYRFENNLEDIQLFGDLREFSSSFPLSVGVVRAAVLSVATSHSIARNEVLFPNSSAVTSSVEEQSESYAADDPSSISMDITDVANGTAIIGSDLEFDQVTSSVEEQSESYAADDPSSSSIDATEVEQDVEIGVSGPEFDEDEHNEYREALFGATIDRSVEGAAIREVAAHFVELGKIDELVSGDKVDRQSLEQNDLDSTLSEFTPPINGRWF